MICPRWLVQSSAAGVIGVALIAVPLWMTAAPGDRAEEETLYRPENSEIQHLRGSAVEYREVRHRNVDHRSIEERNQRVQEVREHLYELYEGPLCPAELDARNQEAIDEAELIIESGWEDALERSLRE